jgi:hypothetical protein
VRGGGAKVNVGNTALESLAWGTEEIQSRIQKCKDGGVPVSLPGQKEPRFMPTWPTVGGGPSPAYVLMHSLGKSTPWGLGRHRLLAGLREKEQHRGSHDEYQECRCIVRPS